MIWPQSWIAENRQRLLGVIAQQGHQVFLTGVDAPGWEAQLTHFPHAMFHVEHGSLVECGALPQTKLNVIQNIKLALQGA